MTIENVTYHFALGHFCAGCKLSVVQHKGCPMLVTKKETLETIVKLEDKHQSLKEIKSTHKT